MIKEGKYSLQQLEKLISECKDSTLKDDLLDVVSLMKLSGTDSITLVSNDSKPL